MYVCIIYIRRAAMCNRIPKTVCIRLRKVSNISHRKCDCFFTRACNTFDCKTLCMKSENREMISEPGVDNERPRDCTGVTIGD